ncbi:hypothetical protein ACFE04_019296 [Oxalis oulophora]
MDNNNNNVNVKKEILEDSHRLLSLPNKISPKPNGGSGGIFAGLADVIALSSDSDSSSSSSSDSDSDSDSDCDDLTGIVNKARQAAIVLGGDDDRGEGGIRVSKKQKVGDDNNDNRSVTKFPPASSVADTPGSMKGAIIDHNFKQFWKAGDYEGITSRNWDLTTGGMDHVRVHPKFLHSNATSHKWSLGAFAELMDNSLDEVCYGATFVNIDMLESKKDGSRMLLIEDNGGGMDPDKMRHCMSLGYSAKSKIVDTIGQYGNGFKTSTMRLGADVIVFSRAPGTDGKRPTQSIGLLSYTFLRSTGMEDIVVPMLDYEGVEGEWEKIIRSSTDWDRNVETIIRWSPFSSEDDLLRQDDQGLSELDFDSDPHDIQLRGVNRDEKHISMAKEYPNSRHFLTYRHSLRSYASILYLRIPPSFRIILRGKDVEHHNIVNDMMMSEKITYRPQPGAEGLLKDSNIAAVVTIGFVKDAKFHIDVQGFNVYHKNRLIKPFWRIWTPSGSDGRGVIGVLEANFVEPAHDKQGFERTTVLARLEQRLVIMQKTYWRTKCHRIGYAPRGGQLEQDSPDGGETSKKRSKSPASDSDKYKSWSNQRKKNNGGSTQRVNNEPPSAFQLDTSDDEGFVGNDPARNSASPDLSATIHQLKEENLRLNERIKKRESEICGLLLLELEKEKEKCKSLETQLEESQKKINELNNEHETLIDVFAEERDRRDNEERQLRKKLKEASNTIEELLAKVMRVEEMKSNKE